MSDTPIASVDRVGKSEVEAIPAKEDILKNDSVPDENQKVNCFSCHAPLAGIYCHRCGQQNDNYRRSISSLIIELFSSIFSLENRIWRTWWALLIQPGKVSREFADGKRTTWTSPVKIYLAISIILFGYLSITQTHIFSIRTSIVSVEDIRKDVADLADSAVKLSPQIGFFRRQAEIDQKNANLDFDRVSRLLEGQPRQAFTYNGNPETLGLTLRNQDLKSFDLWPNDTSQASATSETSEQIQSRNRSKALLSYNEKIESALDSYNNILAQTINPTTIIDEIKTANASNNTFNLTSKLQPNFFNMSRLAPELQEGLKLSILEDLTTLDSDLQQLGLSRDDLNTLPFEIKSGFAFEIGESQFNGITLSHQELQNLFMRTLRNPALLNQGVSKYLPRIMFFMMPFAALIGMIFIRGRTNALLYDHLIHAAYIHSITFAFLLNLVLLSQWTPLNISIEIFLIGMLIYLPLSAKGMFGRSWIKSIFTSYSIAFIYSLIMFILLALLSVQSMASAIKLSQTLS